jgi:hypothetical protein
VIGGATASAAGATAGAAELERASGEGGGCAAYAGSPAHQQQQLAIKQVAPSRDGSSQLWGVSPQKHKEVPGIPAAAATAGTSAGTAAAATAAAAGGLGQSSVLCAGDAAVGVSGEREEECRPGHFQVVHTYDVEGVGWVVSGIAVTGTCTAARARVLLRLLPDLTFCWMWASGFRPCSMPCLAA